MGRAEPGLSTWAGLEWTVHSTVHMLREQWRLAAKEKTQEKEGERGWLAMAVVVGGVAGGDRKRRWWWHWRFAVADGGSAFSFSLSPLFFVIFSASSSFLFFFLLCPLSSLLYCALSVPVFFHPLSVSRSLSLSLTPSSFSSLFPVFIGKNRGGRRGWGGHYAAAPNRPRGTSPSFFHHVASKWVVGVFLRESWRWNRRKNLLLLPCFACPGEEEDMDAVQNGTVSSLSLFFKKITVHETASLLPKRAVSLKWILAPKRVRFKIRPSICARFAFWSLVSDSFN